MLIVLTLGTLVSIFTKAFGSILEVLPNSLLSTGQLNSSTFRRKNNSTDEVSQAFLL